MNISAIETATAKLSAWVAANGQSISLTEKQCNKLSAHGQAAITAMKSLAAKPTQSMD